MWFNKFQALSTHIPFPVPIWDERTEKDSACFVNSKENKWVGSQQSWSKEGTVRHCQSKEVSILWSHHEETRELPGERNNARNNARRRRRPRTAWIDNIKSWTRLCGRVNQNDIGYTRWTKKKNPYDFCWYYSNAWEFLYEILHDC